MLRALDRHRVADLLRERFLADILGVLEPLDLHADVLEESRVRSQLPGPLLLEPSNSLADLDAESLAARRLVEALEHLVRGAELQFLAARLFLCDDAVLVALHHEGHAGAHRDRVESVGVAVEVELDDEVPVEAAHVGAGGRRLVLGPVDRDDLSLVGPRLYLETVDRLGARHRAALPAAVRVVLREIALFQSYRVYLRRVLVLAELVVENGQQIVGVHHVDDIGGADLPHPVLLLVERRHLGVYPHAVVPDHLRIDRVVHVVDDLDRAGGADIGAARAADAVWIDLAEGHREVPLYAAPREVDYPLQYELVARPYAVTAKDAGLRVLVGQLAAELLLVRRAAELRDGLNSRDVRPAAQVHLGEQLTVLLDAFGRALDLDLATYGIVARRHEFLPAALLDFDDAEPAEALGREVLVGAEGRDVNAVVPQHIEQVGALGYRDFLAVDRDFDLFRSHYITSTASNLQTS